MNLQETAQVLAKIQLGDNRQVDELTVREWHDTIGHLEFVDAIAAVKEHRQISSDYLMPAHIVGGAKRAKERRQRQPRIERQLESRAWQPDPGQMQRVCRSMYHSGVESSQTLAYIEGLFEKRGWPL